MNFKIGDLVKSKLNIHKKGLTTWRVEEIYFGLRGTKFYFCKASHDTKKNYGFHKIARDFKFHEIELA